MTYSALKLFVFDTIEINLVLLVLFVTSWLVKKVPMQNESSISLSGTIILLALFVQKKTSLGKYIIIVWALEMWKIGCLGGRNLACH